MESARFPSRSRDSEGSSANRRGYGLFLMTVRKRANHRHSGKMEAERPAEFEHGGEEIHGHDRICKRASLLGHSGADDGRFAYPALVEPMLPAHRSWLLGQDGADVLKRCHEENDDGHWVGQAQIEFGGEGHAVIHRGDYRRGPGCPGMRVPCRAPVGWACFPRSLSCLSNDRSVSCRLGWAYGCCNGKL